MDIGSVTPTNVATSVWANATRTLTGLQTAMLTQGAISAGPITSGSRLSFLPAASKVRWNYIEGDALTNVTWNMELYSRTVALTMIAGASGAQVQVYGCGNSSVGFSLRNSGTVSGNYTYTASDTA